MVRWLEEKSCSVKRSAGSALVLVIVITVLLATVGVMFVMMARVSQTATSAISDNRELAGAVDVVVNRIQTILVDDLFGSDANMLNGPGDSTGEPDEYTDYPGPDDPWLASLEPVVDILSPSGYSWPHISDIYQFIGPYSWFAPAGIVGSIDPNYADADGDGVTDSIFVPLFVTSSKGKPIFAAVRIIDNCGMININTAYRDTTNILGADNWDGSLLTHINLDTDRIHNNYVPNSYRGFVADGDISDGKNAYDLQVERCGRIVPPASDLAYHNDVARRLLNPMSGYTPFDIGDELELRNRFFLSSPVINRFGYKDSQGMSHVLQVTLDPGTSPEGREIPYGSRPSDTIANWFDKATGPEPGTGLCNRRHIATTYSFDRIIRPYDDTPLPGGMADTPGQRKFGIQLPDDIANGTASQTKKDKFIRRLAGAIYRGLPDDSEIAGSFGAEYTRERLAWQFAVNLIDYQDNDGPDPCNPDDDQPTYYKATLTDGSVVKFWGVESPECIKNDTIFISELAYFDNQSGDIIEIPPIRYYAIELYNPDRRAKDFSEFKYEIVVGNDAVLLSDVYAGPLGPEPGGVVVLTNDMVNAPTAFVGRISVTATIAQFNNLIFTEGDEIIVYRKDWPIAGADMPVDRIVVPDGIVAVPPIGDVHSKQRDETLGPTGPPGRIVNNLLWPVFSSNTGELGTVPSFTESDPNVQLYVPNEDLRTIAEIENVFAVGYNDPNDVNNADTVHTLIGDIKELYNPFAPPDELDQYYMKHHGRISLADTNYWSLLDFLTCFDPSNDGVDNDGRNGTDDNRELAIAGRININTAPWFVIKHLPWMGLTPDALDTDNLARAIVAWRDRLNLASIGGPDYLTVTRSEATGLPDSDISEEPGFRSIGELLQVINTSGALDFDIRKYLDGVNNGNMPVSPDYTGDIIDDDFEERDIIFQRISNLVTVRSDVFTAYILVRIGHDGPQKRMIAIFDRSNVFSPADKPRLVALHPVPDPR